jgi:hypothetical protein
MKARAVTVSQCMHMHLPSLEVYNVQQVFSIYRLPHISQSMHAHASSSREV